MIAMPYVIKYISMIMHYFVEKWDKKKYRILDNQNPVLYQTFFLMIGATALAISFSMLDCLSERPCSSISGVGT